MYQSKRQQRRTRQLNGERRLLMTTVYPNTHCEYCGKTYERCEERRILAFESRTTVIESDYYYPCIECSNIIRQVFPFGFTRPTSIYTTHHIVARYRVEFETHDGYCSDPEDERTEIKEETLVFNIPISFGSIETERESILEKAKRFLRFTSTSSHENPCCGCHSKYELIDVIIMEGELSTTEEMRYPSPFPRYMSSTRLFGDE